MCFGTDAFDTDTFLACYFISERLSYPLSDDLIIKHILFYQN